MLGDLIAVLDRQDVTKSVLESLHPPLHDALLRAASMASMSPADFVAGAVRSFVDTADDDLWFQVLTRVRTSQEPGLEAVRTILEWVVTARG